MFLLSVVLVLTACSDDDDNNRNRVANFTETIENIGTAQPIFHSGVFNTPT